jgi:hypothetical protein
MAKVEEVLRLYQETYFDLNIRHFHEKLDEEHGIKLSYTWVQKALQGAGLVTRGRKRRKHRRRRERRPMSGMLLHIDGSKHQWFGDERWYDLIVILDDATSEIYYAQLVEEESTRTVMEGLRTVIDSKGLFCALYSDRGSHFFVTPKAGEKVDKHRLTQVGRALKELGVQMIPAYSPQARGRSERSFGTWQGAVAAGVTAGGNHHARRCQWLLARTLHPGCTVTIHEHLDGNVSIRYGPHVVGRYTAAGEIRPTRSNKTPKSGGKGGTVDTVENHKPVSHSPYRPLEIPPKRDSHFSTAPATASLLRTRIKTKTRKPPSASRRGIAGAIG